MAKGHVGRPTNEEVAARKRKQLLKILVPCILIGVIAVMIITQTGLKGLMGNADGSDCCDTGWKKDGDTCYQENIETSQISAYILGDANNDNIIDGRDYTTMRNDILSGVELDERKQLVYDINDDKTVDLTPNEQANTDLQAFNAMFETSSVGKKLKDDYKDSYICPKESVNETTDENNQTIKTTITYKNNEQDESLCDVTTTTRISKPRVCDKEEMQSTSGNNDSTTIPLVPEETQNNEGAVLDSTCPEDMISIYDESIGRYVCKNVEDDGQIIDNYEEEYTTEDEELDEDDVESSNAINPVDDAYIERKSNYLKYGDNSTDTNKYSITIYTKDKVTGTGVSAAYAYDIYKDENCQYTIVTGSTLNYKTYATWAIKVSGKTVDTHTFDVSKYKLEYDDILAKNVDIKNAYDNKETKNLYVKQVMIDANGRYKEIANNCRKVTLGTDNKNDRILTFENEPVNSNKATITVDLNSKITGIEPIQAKYDKQTKTKYISSGNAYLYIPSVSKYYTGFEGKTKKKYKLRGWTISRKIDGKEEYYCYTNKAHTKKGWASEKQCNSQIVVGTDSTAKKIIWGKESIKSARNVVNVSKYIVEKAAYTFKARWKVEKINVSFINAEKENQKVKDTTYKRYVKIDLYPDYNSCKERNTSKIVNKKVYAQSKLNDKNTGVVKIDNENYKLSTGKNKTYFLAITPSQYYQPYNNDCVKITPGTKNVKVKLVPKTFKINYKKDSKAAYYIIKNPSKSKKKANKEDIIEAQLYDNYATSTTKHTDIPVNLIKNKYKRNGYEFKYWIASRVVNGKTEYRCYVDKQEANRDNASWEQASKCKGGYKKYDDGQSMNINTPQGNITMIAHWDKPKNNTTTKK